MFSKSNVKVLMGTKYKGDLVIKHLGFSNDKDKEIIFLKDQIRKLNRQIKQLRNIIKDLQKNTNQN